MKIAFHRSGDSHDRIYVNRDDGTELGWRWPAGGPPHDLMHYAVETELGLGDGFWGLVAAGANFSFATAHAQADPATRTLSDDQVPGLIRAETIVGAVTSAITVPGFDPEPPEDLDPADFERAREAAQRWLERWRALPEDETLVVSYPPGD
jgi:hypothetical protein